MQECFFCDSLSSVLDGLLKRLGVRRLFLVRGRGSYTQSGAEAVIEPLLASGNIATVHYSGFSANPKMEEVEVGKRLFGKSAADAILAVGGGSTLDMAKLIRHYSASDARPAVPLIAVPTTSGSGAEATHFSVCYIAGEKHSISDPSILPDYALISPALTYANGGYLTACTGFDAVAQAIESFWSVNSTAESTDFSVRALGLLWKQLPLLVADPANKELRAMVAKGAYYAGRAIDITTTTAPHAFSYKFTSLYGYPHGHAVALTFPYFFALNVGGGNLQPTLCHDDYTGRMARLLAVLGCGEEKDGLAGFMESYIRSLQLEVRPFADDEIATVVNSFNRQRAGNNPVVVDDGVIDGLRDYLKH